MYHSLKPLLYGLPDLQNLEIPRLYFQTSVFELARTPYFSSLPMMPEDFIKDSGATYSCECSQCITRLFHNLLAQHQQQANACHEGCAWGLSLLVVPEKWWKFPPVMSTHNALWLGEFQPIFRPTNHKDWYQWVKGHVWYPTDSPTLLLAPD